MIWRNHDGECSKKEIEPQRVVLLIAIALIALFVAALAYQPNEKEPPEPKVDITVTLKNIVETSDLSTSVFKLSLIHI